MKPMALLAMLIILALMIGCANKPKYHVIKYNPDIVKGCWDATPKDTKDGL